MAKIGLNLKIDVSKIDKQHLFKGQKGTYLDATIFVDLDNVDQYGNNGMIVQTWKDAGKDTPILGNGKIFWREQQQQQNNQQQSKNTQQKPPMPDMDCDDDIPF